MLGHVVRRLTLFALMIYSLAAINYPAFADAERTPPQFSTLKGLGFDKWASIWLVEHRITAGTPVIIFDSGSPPAGSLFFDEPSASFNRDADHSTYEKLTTHYDLHSLFLSYFVTTVHDIEIRLWQPDQQSDSHAVETAFRALQDRWGREHVPRVCYGEFFDQLERLFEKQHSLRDAEALLPNLSCWKQALSAELTDPQVLVTEMPIPTVLGHLRSGARIVFVDVREPDEFQENHIPGAINLSISAANATTTQFLREYDVVVAYCIKDFRGFEMARKLRDLGIQQSVILNPFGIRGWIGSNLPVYKAGAVSEAQAQQAFKSCIDDPSTCQSLPKEKQK